MLKGHGDDIYNYKHKIASNFSSNVYGNQDLTHLKKHLRNKIELIHSYPEPDAHSLAVEISIKHDINPQNVAVTNGATEAIYMIAQAYSNSHSTILIQTFSEYADACHLHKHKVSFCKDLKDIDQSSELVWICNPNNPDGRVHDKEKLRDLISKNQHILFIIDQSYEFFTLEETWSSKEALELDNVVILHSMTKKFAIPGIRLGYFISSDKNIERITKNRMPWSVNALAVEAGKFLLNQPFDGVEIREYLKETARLQHQLSQINGLKVLPTKTHYFLCKLENRSASELKEWLAKELGILIRDAGNFKGLDKTYFRIATQTPVENDNLVKGITAWI